MSINHKPWYNHLGPLAWYRREWVGFSLSRGETLILDVLWKPGRYLCVHVGGRVNRRSMYGRPSSIESWWSWARMAKRIRHDLL